MMKNSTIKLMTLLVMVTLSVSITKATVQYNDISDVTLTLTGAGQTLSHGVDLNGDLTIDFYINVSNEAQSIDAFTFAGESVTVGAPSGVTTNSVLQTDGSPYELVQALNTGVIIQGSSTTWDNVGGVLAASGTVNGFLGISEGEFDNAGDRYIAVKFAIGAATHYGWVRVNVTNYNSIIIKDFAYESVADQSILSGQTVTTGLNKSLATTTTVKNINNTLEVEFANLFDGKIQVVTISGQVVRSVNVNGKSSSIDMTTMTTGIYTLVISGNEGYAAKKVVIQ